MEGASEGEMDEPLVRQAARLCHDAGADGALIPAWIEEGRRRRAHALRPPFSAPEDHPDQHAAAAVTAGGVAKPRVRSLQRHEQASRPLDHMTEQPGIPDT